jgi:catalase
VVHSGMNNAIPYAPGVERPEPDEAHTTQELIETLTKISATVYEDSQHALRSVHAKSHGLVRGSLAVKSDLPAELAQGLFGQATVYPVVVRLSSTPGDWLKDSVSTPRGLAIKIFNAPGERLPDAQGHTQDFIFVNGPAFAAPDARHFLKNLKLLAGTTDKSPALKSALSLALRSVERVVEAAGGQSGTLKSLGGHPATHPLGETYFTQVPLLYGAYMAKLRLRPAAPELIGLIDQAVDIRHSPNALRDKIREFFRTQSGSWDLEVQLCRDLEHMPIEDASVVWPEALSPYQPVGRLTVPQQDSWPEASTAGVEDRLSFSPWHGIAAHRPLGSVMRVRKATYEASVRFRAEHNNVTIDEPAECPALK